MDINNLEIFFQYDRNSKLEKLYSPLFIKLFSRVKSNIDNIICCIHNLPLPDIYRNKTFINMFYFYSSIYLEETYDSHTLNLFFNISKPGKPDDVMYQIRIHIDLDLIASTKIYVISDLYNNNLPLDKYEFNKLFNILNNNIDVYSNLIKNNIKNTTYDYFL